MSREGDCDVAAVKVTLPGTALYVYVEIEVIRADSHLPEGGYTLIFDGRSMPVQKYRYAWLAPGP
jgi:hypothetical protein